MISDEEKQIPNLTSIASREVMALKRAMDTIYVSMTLFSFFCVGEVAAGLHGSFTTNSPLRELARGAFLASWPVTNVPV